MNFAYSEQFAASYGVFIHHIAAETGWGRTALAGTKTVSRLVEAALAPFIGPLVDRYGARWLSALGMALWLLPPTPATLLGGIVLFAAGAAGSQVASELIWASYFGRLSLGTVRGIAYPIQTFFAAMGPFVVGVLYDLSGSYQSSFAIMVVGCLASAGLIQLAQPPKPPENTTS